MAQALLRSARAGLRAAAPAGAVPSLRGLRRDGVLALATLALAAPAAPATLTGEVLDPSGHGLPGTIVILYPVIGSTPLLTTTGENGTFDFNLAAGAYTAVVSREGYHELVTPAIDLEAEELHHVTLRLQLQIASEITVEIDPAESATRPVEAESFTADEFELLRLPSDRFQETLPLLPGVVRDRRGRLSFDGTRPSQSLLLVNGSSATDPLTGEFAVELPLKAIDTVTVYTLPYSAEYGRVTGAVTEVITRAGDDHWDVEFGGLIPKLRIRDGGLRGISSATPRLQLSGPLVPGNLWVSQGFTYRFLRARAYDLEDQRDEEILESFDSFTQLTAALGSHTLTTTFALFPVEVDELGIDTLRPAESAPEFDSTGWNLGVSHRLITGRDALLETAVALKKYDVSVGEDGPISRARLVPEGLRGSYFNAIDRDSSALELSTTWSRFLRRSWGSHLVKVGADVAWLDFQADDTSAPVDVVSSDGRTLRTISFEGDGAVEATDLVAGLFVNDEWRPTPRLGLTLGLRYDFDRIADEHHVSPRLAASWSVTPGGGTILKGGWGRFYDRVPLHAASFEDFQRRTEVFAATDGAPARRLAFANRTGSLGVRVPRSDMWHAEVNQQIGANLALRVNYRERRGSRELFVDRVEEGPAGPELRLSSDGESLIRELDVTLRRGFGRDGELLLSWSKRRTTATLNAFDAIYGNLRDPLILAAQHSLQPFDVPSRVLLWGEVRLPWKLTVAPALEWRRGFPYTVFDEGWSPVGLRNRGGRRPSFFSADLTVTREVTLLGYEARIGVRASNLTDHFNPRDVQVNRASPRFLELANGVPLRLNMTLQVSF